jgi:hypothetical protein
MLGKRTVFSEYERVGTVEVPVFFEGTVYH